MNAHAFNFFAHTVSRINLQVHDIPTALLNGYDMIQHSWSLLKRSIVFFSPFKGNCSSDCASTQILFIIFGIIFGLKYSGLQRPRKGNKTSVGNVVLHSVVCDDAKPR